MINPEHWFFVFTEKLKAVFAHRLLFVGYQGSYRRGEADENSDIDAVVILDEIGFEDLEKYKSVVSGMPEGEKACGFISGAAEIEAWAGNELFQLYYDTKAVYGDLDDLIPPLGAKDAVAAVKSGAQALYHGAVHSFLYARDLPFALRELYKGVFFILQAEYYVRSGEYILNKSELLSKLEGAEKEVLQICSARKEIPSYPPEKVKYCCKKLMEFCRGRIKGPRI
ncbi:MAG: nucleotidyltransferase domain-containing protein [Elusimicrobia bacterium]|nr:nucleotidyltransferase domain-containing protein [Elusimicrobiota bacterium]